MRKWEDCTWVHQYIKRAKLYGEHGPPAEYTLAWKEGAKYPEPSYLLSLISKRTQSKESVSAYINVF